MAKRRLRIDGDLPNLELLVEDLRQALGPAADVAVEFRRRPAGDHSLGHADTGTVIIDITVGFAGGALLEVLKAVLAAARRRGPIRASDATADGADATADETDTAADETGADDASAG